MGIPHVEDLYDITKENILKINLKMEEDLELRPIYVNALASNVTLHSSRRRS